MSKKNILIITDNYEYKGGIRVMTDSIRSKYKNSNVKIASIISKKCKLEDIDIIKIHFPFNFIYLIRIFFLPILIRKRIKRSDRIIVIAPNPLLALMPPLFHKNIILWYATTFPDETINKSFSRLSKKNKIVLFFDFILLPIYFFLERIILQNRKIKIAAISTKSANYHKIKRNIKIIRYPIEKFWYDKTAEKRSGVISVARYNDPRKDLKTLLKTAIILKDVNFVVIGPLPDNFNAKSYINIHFLGELDRKDIKKYYDRAKVFYLPSKQEGLGIVYLEALACGLPIITMKNGGAEEIIKDGDNGFLLEKGDYIGAAEKIKMLLWRYI